MIEFNTTELEEVFFNGVDLDEVYMNGILVFEKNTDCDGANNPSTTTAVPIMTSNTAPSGTCSANEEGFGSYPACNAFDNQFASVWMGDMMGSGNADWIKYTWSGTAPAINKYSLRIKDAPHAAPVEWDLYGSNGSQGDEVLLDSVRNGTVGTSATWFTFINDISYKYLVLYIRKTSGNSSTQMNEINFVEIQC